MQTIIPRVPSIARLEQIKADNAAEFRKRAKQGFERNRHQHISHDVAAFLEELNRISGHFGVESLFPSHPHLWYLNAGDSYTATVFYNHATSNLYISDLATAIGA